MSTFQRLPGEPLPADEVAPRGTKAWRQAVNARRAFMGDQLWQMQAKENLNLSDPNALSGALGRLGITPEKGGGRHLYRLFMGDLPGEGFGMSSPDRGISYGLEAYMPDWKRYHDRMLQRGVPRRDAQAQYWPWMQGR